MQSLRVWVGASLVPRSAPERTWGGTLRLDQIEIKVNLSGDQTQAAVDRLELPAVDQPWQIYFCEDVAPGVSPATPLKEVGVILRARHKPGKQDDSTVKLRPVRRSQLTDDWLEAEKGDGWEVKVEGDWAGEGRVLAVSHTADRPDDVLADAAERRRPPSSFFTKQQEAFLRDCSSAAVNLKALTVLPPVIATRWDSVEKAPGQLGVRAERWTVDDLDFLELSTVAKQPGEADSRQSALLDYVHSLGLAVDSNPESKTDRVLKHLVLRALDAG
jgi:hypothetical protein